MRDDRISCHTAQSDVKKIVTGGVVYIIDHIVRICVHHSWSTSYYLQPQESQVARSQIKNADEHQRAKSDPCLRGCFCASEPHWHSGFSFASLLSPFCLPFNGAVPSLSVHQHLAYSPLGVTVKSLGRGGTNKKRERLFSISKLA